MSRHIDANWLLDALNSIISDYTSEGKYPNGFGIEDAINLVEAAPTLTPQNEWVGVEERRTNADRIRAMDDEQLAKFLCEFRSCAYEGHPCDNCKGDPYCTAGHNGMIDWLEKPAEENAHEPL